MVKFIGFLAVLAFCGAAQVMAQNPQMDDSLRQIVLDAHNTLRSVVALGQAVNKDGSKLPAAANMNKMTYSTLVESYAQDHASSCVYGHNSVNGTSNNLWATGSTAGYTDAADALNTSVYSWYSELASNGQASLVMDGSNYNHFTQVVWADSVEIGCAVANCPTWSGEASDGFMWTYVVCDYSPAGNITPEPIYIASSSPGSQCPSNAPASSQGLCVDPSIEDIH